jgi:hypothetical protein
MDEWSGIDFLVLCERQKIVHRPAILFIFFGTDYFTNITNSLYPTNQFKLFVTFIVHVAEHSGCQENFERR